MNLINFVAIEIKLDTEKNQIHNKLYFKIIKYCQIISVFKQQKREKEREREI